MTSVPKEGNNWKNPSIPNRGWRCVDIYDGNPEGDHDMALCQMCNEREIRYIHVMAHPDLPFTMQCGCVCASNMEGDHEAPKKRERDLKNRIAREREAARQARERAQRDLDEHIRDRKFARMPLSIWDRTKKGGYHEELDTIYMLIFERKDGWSWKLDPCWRDKPIWGRNTHRSAEDAWDELKEKVDDLFEFRIRRLREALG